MSVLDFEKQEREKEVQELTVQKEELSQSITEMQAAADKETENLHELQEQKTAVRKEILKLSSDKYPCDSRKSGVAAARAGNDDHG